MSPPPEEFDWGYLINPDKSPSSNFEHLCLGIARFIQTHLHPTSTAELIPEKLAEFYRSVGGNYDNLFLQTPNCSLSFIYKSLGCFHTLQPTLNAFETPCVPSLLPQGFVRWQTIQLLLCPEEHSSFLREAVRRHDIINPDNGLVFPKTIPESAFPSKPDADMLNWHETLSHQLEKEYHDSVTAKSRYDSPPPFYLLCSSCNTRHHPKNSCSRPGSIHEDDFDYFHRPPPHQRGSSHPPAPRSERREQHTGFTPSLQHSKTDSFHSLRSRHFDAEGDQAMRSDSLRHRGRSSTPKEALRRQAPRSATIEVLEQEDSEDNPTSPSHHGRPRHSTHRPSLYEVVFPPPHSRHRPGTHESPQPPLKIHLSQSSKANPDIPYTYISSANIQNHSAAPTDSHRRRRYAVPSHRYDLDSGSDGDEKYFPRASSAPRWRSTKESIPQGDGGYLSSSAPTSPGAGPYLRPRSPIHRHHSGQAHARTSRKSDTKDVHSNERSSRHSYRQHAPTHLDDEPLPSSSRILAALARMKRYIRQDQSLPPRRQSHQGQVARREEAVLQEEQEMEMLGICTVRGGRI
ncbi:hypothetical protein FQN57_004512 [Myotisia sp. PD_48]|nr:hypothetical protein FQN57_004512 [Myotisia sp. PD_48]